MALKVGDKAPNFTLFDSDKQQVSLEDFQGEHVVLLFFPLAFHRRGKDHHSCGFRMPQLTS